MTILRTFSALLLTFSLAACGGQYDIDTTVQTAAATTVSSAAPQAAIAAMAPATAEAVALGGAPAAVTVASATMPAPDCAAEGCAGLRIIDGNAEAWRIDAQRRAALEASLPQT